MINLAEQLKNQNTTGNKYMDILFGVFALGSLIVLAALGSGVFIKGMKEKDVSLTVLGLFIVAITTTPLVTMSYDIYQKEKATLNRECATLIVVDKNHQPRKSNMMFADDILIPIQSSEQWNVVFTDGEHTKTINDETLFNMLEIGNKVEGYKDTYIKKNGKLYTIELSIKGYEESEW